MGYGIVVICVRADRGYAHCVRPTRAGLTRQHRIALGKLCHRGEYKLCESSTTRKVQRADCARQTVCLVCRFVLSGTAE